LQAVFSTVTDGGGLETGLTSCAIVLFWITANTGNQLMITAFFVLPEQSNP